MYTTNLRKVGGSVMLTVPPAILNLLHLKAGAKVNVTVDRHRLVIESDSRPRYQLDELLAQCNAGIDLNDEDREWLDSKPVGRELL